VIVTVPVTFLVFFAGVAGPNAASGVTGALLVYVLPAASTGTLAIVPDRLAGWWLASVAGTAAVLLLSPRAGADPLRAAAAKLAVTLADELDGALRGTPEPARDASLEAKQQLLTRFTATPYRPVGLNAPDQALANAIELLEWCTSLLADCINERSDLSAAPPAARELLMASEAVLRAVATLLTGGEAEPDLDRLERSRAHCLAWLNELSPGRADFAQDLQVGFHADTIAVAVLGRGGDSLVASGKADPEWVAAERRRFFLGSQAGARALRRVSSLAAAARQDASVRSVWFLNSLRGAVALAVAVGVADLTSVQHGFWVVLGTLSVLRTNAASTGATAIRALGGTAVGFVIGGALLLAIGSTSSVLWIVLPAAVLVAAYTPGTAPFAVGQAAFTVTIAVLFNLLVPVGWSVGVIRIEDVAIGCAVSVVVGGLFWPRGLSSVVGDDLADTFRSGASYLTQAVGWATGRDGVTRESAVAAVTSASRLDDALRGFLAEQGSKRIEMRELWRLVGGSMRLRLTAHSITNLPRMPAGDSPLSKALNERAGTLAAWYGCLAELVGKPHERTIPALSVPVFDEVEPGRGPVESRYVIWLDEYLDHLSEHLAQLVPPARRVAEVRRKPWWR
jgi:uncharacterized membrane protein YccC